MLYIGIGFLKSSRLGSALTGSAIIGFLFDKTHVPAIMEFLGSNFGIKSRRYTAIT